MAIQSVHDAAAGTSAVHPGLPGHAASHEGEDSAFIFKLSGASRQLEGYGLECVLLLQRTWVQLPTIT